VEIRTCEFLSYDESNFIAQYVIDNEEQVKNTGIDVYEGTAKDSLTGRYMSHNYLFTPCGDILRPKLVEVFGKGIIVQCWANIFRKGEGIREHEHGVNAISGNIFLKGDPNHGTYYENEKVINKIGELTYFHSELRHHVKPNPDDEPRVSMAIDVQFDWNLKESRKQKMLDQSDRFFYITK
tara:strand:+ start:1092 stop:1634 length:543 start_codon:yes stop_codon:yes gene_type:complete